MEQPENTFQGNKFAPATPKIAENAYQEDNGIEGDDGDVALSGKTEMSNTAGQPDKWPQRPDVVVPKAKVAAGGPNLLGRIPD